MIVFRGLSSLWSMYIFKLIIIVAQPQTAVCSNILSIPPLNKILTRCQKMIIYVLIITVNGSWYEHYEDIENDMDRLNLRINTENADRLHITDHYVNGHQFMGMILVHLWKDSQPWCLHMTFCLSKKYDCCMDVWCVPYEDKSIWRQVVVT